MQDVKDSYCSFTGESTLRVPEQLPTRDRPVTDTLRLTSPPPPPASFPAAVSARPWQISGQPGECEGVGLFRKESLNSGPEKPLKGVRPWRLLRLPRALLVGEVPWQDSTD